MSWDVSGPITVPSVIWMVYKIMVRQGWIVEVRHVQHVDNNNQHRRYLDRAYSASTLHQVCIIRLTTTHKPIRTSVSYRTKYTMSHESGMLVSRDMEASIRQHHGHNQQKTLLSLMWIVTVRWQIILQLTHVPLHHYLPISEHSHTIQHLQVRHGATQRMDDHVLILV